jgi:UDP-glucose 4-epimerase
MAEKRRDAKMTVMITGATGFIGSQLAYHFWSHGTDFILIDNFSYGSYDNLTFPDHDFSDQILIMDIRDRDGMAKLMSENDIAYTYHFAGIAPLPDCQADPQNAVDINVVGTVNILENARRYGMKKMIFASTNAIYENETEFPAREDQFNLPTLVYPNTKYVAERFCESYCKTYGMNVTCLRFSNFYGPHIDCLRKQPPFVGYMIRELHYDRTPVFHSTGEQRRDYIYVDDLIDLAVRVQQNEGFDVVNVAANRNYSVNEMYAIASLIMGKKIKADYAASNHYWAKYPDLYDGVYTIKNEILDHEVNKYSLCDNTYAREKYGWEPKVSIEDGLRKVIEY